VLLPGVFSSLTRIQFTYLPLHTVAYSQTISIRPLSSYPRNLCALLHISITLDPEFNYSTISTPQPITKINLKQIYHLQPSTTMPSTMPSNPFSRLTRTSSVTSSDTNSLNTTSSTSSTSSWTSLLQKNTPVSTYSTINSPSINNTSSTEPSNKTTLSPGEKQKIRQQDRMSMQVLAIHAAMR
jgi:hypothetical protein